MGGGHKAKAPPLFFAPCGFLMSTITRDMDSSKQGDMGFTTRGLGLVGWGVAPPTVICISGLKHESKVQSLSPRPDVDEGSERMGGKENGW